MSDTTLQELSSGQKAAISTSTKCKRYSRVFDSWIWVTCLLRFCMLVEPVFYHVMHACRDLIDLITFEGMHGHNLGDTFN